MVRSAVLGAALLLTSCGGAVSDEESLARRERLVTFVDETLQATTQGLEVDDSEYPKWAEDCSPPGSHNWTYTTFIPVTGTRAKRLTEDVVTYWRARGFTVSRGPGLSAYVHLDALNFGIHDVGPSGSIGMSIGGSTHCMRGDGPEGTISP